MRAAVADERAILERHLRRLLASRKTSWFRRMRIRRELAEDLHVGGRPPRRAKYLVRHLKAQERRIRRGYLLDRQGNANLETAIAKAVERVLKRVPTKYK